ncbi:DUF397 domain-containing protein [Amycolatopsis rhabdoformis]|uniref:DUF397 domain-containing protein n=1 Tax=Amycolatopsis rhabdoformis TaxID=1448059 RepID=A0ABZ1IHK3_9PSEU|nr:DUF397 domain-containing protein [Amycolatopsis rhabdoformis]WSE33422.1 DUF397 domain-containing protein [Amycolatopsis rhabdoformis]
MSAGGFLLPGFGNPGIFDVSIDLVARAGDYERECTVSDEFAGQWIKASYSSSGGQCVEAAVLSMAVGVRDTKARETGHLTVTPAAWVAFTEAVAK